MNNLNARRQNMQDAFSWFDVIPKGITKNKKLKRNYKLYRYINLSQFLSWMETKQTYLTRIETWDDPQEIPIKGNYPDDPEKQAICNELYGQCWSLNSDSDALWRIYSQNHEGLMIETTVAKFDHLKELKFGVLSPIIYGDYSDDLGNSFFSDFPYPMHRFLAHCTNALFKREAFIHEIEVRLVALNAFSFDDPLSLRFQKLLLDKPKCIPLPLKPKGFITGIMIDPRASDWYVDTIKRYCKRYKLDVEPKKSTLYAPLIEP